jgi:hypothetical protein
VTFSHNFSTLCVFTGKKFWVYNGDNFTEGSPRPLTDYGLPPVIDKIDAVLVWKKNSKTFLYRSVLSDVPAYRYTYICELGSSISIVSSYGLDDRTIEVQSPAEVKGFFLYPLCPDWL